MVSAGRRSGGGACNCCPTWAKRSSAAGQPGERRTPRPSKPRLRSTRTGQRRPNWPRSPSGRESPRPRASPPPIVMPGSICCWSSGSSRGWAAGGRKSSAITPPRKPRWRLRAGDPPVAERFELYLEGIELANGYVELLDPEVLRARNRASNARSGRLTANRRCRSKVGCWRRWTTACRPRAAWLWASTAA